MQKNGKMPRYQRRYKRFFQIVLETDFPKEKETRLDYISKLEGVVVHGDTICVEGYIVKRYGNFQIFENGDWKVVKSRIVGFETMSGESFFLDPTGDRVKQFIVKNKSVA